jgi:hypothetical protein
LPPFLDKRLEEESDNEDLPPLADNNAYQILSDADDDSLLKPAA